MTIFSRINDLSDNSPHSCSVLSSHFSPGTSKGPSSASGRAAAKITSSNRNVGSPNSTSSSGNINSAGSSRTGLVSSYNHTCSLHYTGTQATAFPADHIFCQKFCSACLPAKVSSILAI